jgi:hypothetical protein
LSYKGKEALRSGDACPAVGSVSLYSQALVPE